MKVFFDTNVYAAEALLGGAAEQIVLATVRARWRIFGSPYIFDEIERVLIEKLGFSRRLARLTRIRASRRAAIVFPPPSRHQVPQDPNDSPILRAALSASADLLITNDSHLLALNPYESLKIVSMDEYFSMLVAEGLIAL